MYTGSISMKYSLLIFCVFMISLGQVLFKIVATGCEYSLVEKFFQPVFLLALFVYMAATILWIWLLQTIPLNVAYPFMALAFVMVPILGYFMIDERLNYNVLLGGGLIMVGVYVIAK